MTNHSGNFSSLGVMIPTTATLDLHTIGGIGASSHAFTPTTYNEAKMERAASARHGL